MDELITVSPDLIAELANFRPGMPRPVLVPHGPRSMPLLPRPIVRGTPSESEEEDIISGLAPHGRAGKVQGSRPAKRARPAAVEPAPEAWQASLVQGMENARLAGEDVPHPPGIPHAPSPPNPKPPLPAARGLGSGGLLFSPAKAVADVTPPRRRTKVKAEGVEDSLEPSLPPAPKFLEDDADSVPDTSVAVKQEEKEVTLPESEAPLPPAPKFFEDDADSVPDNFDAVKLEEVTAALPALAASLEPEVALPVPVLSMEKLASGPSRPALPRALVYDDDVDFGEMSAAERFDASLPEPDPPLPAMVSSAKAMAVVHSSPRNLTHSRACVQAPRQPRTTACKAKAKCAVGKAKAKAKSKPVQHNKAPFVSEECS